MDDRRRLRAGPLKLTRAQVLAREKARLEAEIRCADAQIAELEALVQRLQALQTAIHPLDVREAPRG